MIEPQAKSAVEGNLQRMERQLAAPHSAEIYIAAFFSCSSTTALTLPGK